MGRTIRTKTTAHLSSAGLNGFRPPEGAERVWDDEIRGFGLRRRGKATDLRSWQWVFCYRHKNSGKQITRTYGSVATYTPEEARRWASKVAKAANTSDDLWEKEQAKRAATEAEKRKPTVTQLWIEWRAARGEAKKSARDDESLWRVHLEPIFGRMRVSDVTPADVDRFKDSKRQNPARANRMIALLSAMFTLATKRGYRAGCAPEHPIKSGAVVRFREIPSDFYFRPEEVGRLVQAADTDANKVAGLAIRMLAHTGARSSEVKTAHWGQFEEMEDGRLHWTVEATNTKGERAVLRVLDPDLSERLKKWKPDSLGMCRVQKLGAKQYVFPHSGDATKPILSLHQAWDRIKKAASVQRGRIHDLRHTVATVLTQETGSLEAAQQQLGHATSLTTRRYAHLTTVKAESASNVMANQMRAAEAKADAARDRADVILLSPRT